MLDEISSGILLPGGEFGGLAAASPCRRWRHLALGNLVEDALEDVRLTRGQGQTSTLLHRPEGHVARPPAATSAVTWWRLALPFEGNGPGAIGLGSPRAVRMGGAQERQQQRRAPGPLEGPCLVKKRRKCRWHPSCPSASPWQKPGWTGGLVLKATNIQLGKKNQ